MGSTVQAGGDVLSGLPFAVPSQYYDAIVGAAAQYGIRPKLLAAQIEAESGFKNLGPNSAGAVGVAQFTPATALSVGVNPRDPVSSIYGAAKLDSQYIAKYGSEDLALAAYNAGPNAPGIAQGRIPDYPETQDYVKRILGMAGAIGGATDSATPANDPASPPTTGAEALAKLKSGTAWTRLGKGAMGILLALIGMWFAFSQTATGKTLTGQAKEAVKLKRVA